MGGEDDLVKAMTSRSRNAPERLWTALLLRDRGCRFPGCRCILNLVPHHIEHWVHGGKTEYWNLVLLCPVHHRAVHEGGFSVELARSGDAYFKDRTGMPIPACAPPPRIPDPIELLRAQWKAECSERGGDPETPRGLGQVRNARWLPDGLMERAMEALVEERNDRKEQDSVEEREDEEGRKDDKERENGEKWQGGKEGRIGSIQRRRRTPRPGPCPALGDLA